MDSDHAEQRRLLLAGGDQAWLWLLVGGLVVVLLVVLYRHERRLVSQRLGLALLSIRLAAALVLVVFLFEPIAARTYREELRGRVVVGIDLSGSMSTVDATRPEDDRRRLAQVLDLSPAEAVEHQSRRSLAGRFLAGEWLRRIAAVHDVVTLGFAREAVPGTPESLAALARSERPATDDLSATDFSPVLAAGLQGDGSTPTVAVVLLTDGGQNVSAAGADLLAQRLAARGVPAFPVLIGSTSPPRDAAVASIKTAQLVYRNDVATVEATIKVDAAPGTELPVVLEMAGIEPQRKTVSATSDGSRPVVTFRVPMEEVGTHALTITVGPLDEDARPDNDRRTVSVQVADDKARVLLIDGEARWEFRYLRNALTRDPRVSVEAVVVHQPAIQGATTTYTTTPPPPPDLGDDGKPLADPLGAFDAIVLGDMGAGDLTTEFWGRLDRYVSERGGTLVFSAGPRHWPGLVAGNDTARRLVPVLDPMTVPIDGLVSDPDRPTLPGGVIIAPVPSAMAGPWPMLQFAAEPEQYRETWLTLPRLPWALSGRVKPGATALVGVTGQGASASEDEAVIAAQPYGLGKVLWVGTDGTWRWRYRVGDRYHHRFWGQVVRWAASGKLAAGNRLVRFGPDRPRVAAGQGARLQARFSDQATGVRPEMLVAARVFREGDETGDAVAVVPLRAVDGQPRVFEGTTPALAVGRYVARLDAPEQADVLQAEGGPPQAPFEVQAPDTSEDVELAAVRDTLDRLAATTNGRVFTDTNADALPDLLRASKVEHTRTVETPLWDQPPALLLFFGLITAEWVVRKRAGLP
jgi:hypothetical protein